jgi:hypothetical protein
MIDFVRGGLVIAVLLALPSRAAAETREQCFDAYERAQRLRRSGKLIASREQLLVCADTSCPSFVKTDCSAWLGEVEASSAAVTVLVQRDEKSKSEGAVTVFVDGERVAEPIEDHPVPVDPGPHDVRCELGGRSVERHVVVPEGNKAFPLLADFRTPASQSAPLPRAPSPPAPANGGTPPPPRPGWPARIPPLTVALGGVTVAGLALFAGFGLAGNSAESCAPSCTPSQVSSVRTDFVVADVSLAVALASGGAALYFALTAKPDASPDRVSPPRAAWWLGVRPGPAGSGATVSAGARF